MAIHHADSGEIVCLPLGTTLSQAETIALVKTSDFEVIRLVVPAGKQIPTHRAPGSITVQCLEGGVSFTAHGKTQQLVPGDFLYLAEAEPHALSAIDDSSLLVTILLPKP